MSDTYGTSSPCARAKNSLELAVAAWQHDQEYDAMKQRLMELEEVHVYDGILCWKTNGKPVAVK